jgi:hypothetical protein
VLLQIYHPSQSHIHPPLPLDACNKLLMVQHQSLFCSLCKWSHEDSAMHTESHLCVPVRLLLNLAWRRGSWELAVQMRTNRF